MNLAYLTHLATVYAIQLILVGSFSFLFGGIGVANLAHLSTAAVGAYASALLVLRLGWDPLAAIAAATAVGVGGGLALGLLLRRVRGDYLALLALAVHLVVVAVLLNWDAVTRGALGLPGIPRPGAFAAPGRYLLLSGGLAALALAGYAAVLRSPYGRVMAAIRDDEVAAAALGKRVGSVRMVAYLASSGGAALAGALLAHFLQFIDPNSFPLAMLALALAAAIVGGVASTAGVLAGTAVVTFVPEALRFLSVPPALVGPLRQILFSVLVIAILIVRPRGIFGRIDVR